MRTGSMKRDRYSRQERRWLPPVPGVISRMTRSDGFNWSNSRLQRGPLEAVTLHHLLDERPDLGPVAETGRLFWRRRRLRLGRGDVRQQDRRQGPGCKQEGECEAEASGDGLAEASLHGLNERTICFR